MTDTFLKSVNFKMGEEFEPADIAEILHKHGVLTKEELQIIQDIENKEQRTQCFLTLVKESHGDIFETISDAAKDVKDYQHFREKLVDLLQSKESQGKCFQMTFRFRQLFMKLWCMKNFKKNEYHESENEYRELSYEAYFRTFTSSISKRFTPNSVSFISL